MAATMTAATMTVRFDVSKLTMEECGQLAAEVAVQADRSDGHPAVPPPEIEWDGAAEIDRTVVVHLNVAVTGLRTAAEVAAYLEDALTVGMESHEGGDGLDVTFVLAEEL